MIDPSINSLMKRVDSKYTLVILTAKRARKLAGGDDKLTEVDSDKPVTVAIHEINEGKVIFKRTKDSYK